MTTRTPGRRPEELPAVPDIFISYSRTDETPVRRLYDALKGMGRQVWVDWGSIHPSAEWDAEIERGIRSANAFLFVISPDSLLSEVCQRELDRAARLNKRLIPVICHDVQHTDVPPAIGSRQWIFMREQDDFGTALDALNQALDLDVDWLHRHNSLLGQALAWRDAGDDSSRLLKGTALKQAEAWLTQGAGKEPAPAPVHLAFLQASRSRATKVLRRLIVVSVGGMLLALILTGWALLASYAAQQARDEALARGLGAEATLAGSERDELIERSALLAIESSYLKPSRQNDIPLRRAFRLLPAAQAAWENAGQPVIDAVYLDSARIAFAIRRRDAQVILIADLASAPQHKRTITGGDVAELAACAGGRVLAIRRTTSVDLYDVPGANHITSLVGDGIPTRIHCTPDSDLLAVGWQPGTVSLYHAADGEQLFDLPDGLAAPVHSLALDSRLGLVAAGTASRHRSSAKCLQGVQGEPGGGAVNTLAVWSVASGAPVSRSAHCQPVENIHFDPAGGRIATASDSGAYLWSLRDGSLMQRLGHETNVRSVHFSPDSTMLVTGSGWSAHIWDLQQRRRWGELMHQGPVTSARFSADGSEVLTASNDHTARLWRVADGRELLRFPHYRGGVRQGDDPYVVTADFDPAGERILTAARDGRVRVWNRSVAVAADYFGKLQSGRRVWSADGRFMAQTSGRTQWELRRFPGARVMMHFRSPNPLLALDVSPDGKRMAAATFGRQVLLLDIVAGEHLRSIDIPCEAGARSRQLVDPCVADAVSLDPLGRHLLTGSRDGYVRYWSADDGQMLWQEHAPGFVMSTVFSRAGDLAAMGGTDRIARVRRSEDGSLLHALRHPHDVRDLAFSPDGKHLATACSDGLARIWNLDSGATQRHLQHRYPVLSVAWNPDGNRVVTGSTDATARIWDAQSGVELSRIALAGNESDNIVQRSSFLSDEEILVVENRQVAVYPVRMEMLVDEVCARLTRNLDALEWLEFMGSVEPRATCPGLPLPDLGY